MNKRLLKLLLIYMVFATLRLYAQNTNDAYYYYEGKKIFLEIDYNRISVSLRGEEAVKKIQSRFTKNFSKRNFSKRTLTEITQDYAKTSVIEIGTSTFDKNKSRRKKSVKNQGVSKHFYTEASFSKTYSDKEYKNLLESYNNITNIQAAPAFLTKEGKKMGLSNKFYVKLKKQEDLNDLLEKAKELKVEILGRNKFMPLWFTLVVTKDSKRNALGLANLFHQTGIFEASEPAFVYHDLLNMSDPNISDPNGFISDPNDTYFSDQWALENTGQNYGTFGVDIKAKKAWEITTGFNTKVAVIDEGVQKGHPDLESNLEPGYDAHTNSYPANLYGSHGTSCAGIIGSIKDNNKGIAGIAPSSRLIPVSIDFGNSTADKFADAINWAWKNGADVISNSWGGGSPSEIKTDAIKNALTKGRKGKGSVVVFSSGNENSDIIGFPKNSDPRILCVGAIDQKGKRSIWNYVRNNGHWYWEGSNYGHKLDVVAGGTNIVTTTTKSGYDSSFGGTSAAAPFAAGVAALVISVNPYLTVTEVTDIIEKTAQKLVGYNYDYENDRSNGTRNYELGYGLVDAHAAVVLAQSPDYNIEIPPEGQAQCLEHDYFELSKFYKTTNVANWKNKWDLKNPISTWDGVTLTEDSCSVESINLSGLGIRGSIPNLDLSNLKYLDLSSNKLSEAIPKFNSLPSLQKLDLSHNELSGAIPNLQQLDTLDIRENNFTFKGIEQNLAIKNFRYSPQKPIHINTTYTSRESRKLYVDVGGSVKNNTYTWYKDGTKHNTIDSTLAITDITELGSYYCEVTNSEITNEESDYQNLVLQSDTIKVNICSLKLKQDSLELVKLYNATDGGPWWNLSKPISKWDGIRLTDDGCSVKSIDLSYERLSGPIPNFNLPKLERLWLGKNQLSGSIPNFNLPNLQELSLYENQLSGAIPNFNLPKLERLWLSKNQLSGAIPNFNLPKLERLWLYKNQLSGSIPNFDLPNLQELSLYENQLSGSIPNFDLPNLWELSLYKNQLSGSIPNFDLPNLQELSLYENQLSGSIPNFDLPKLRNLYLYKNQLSGSIPNLFDNLPYLNVLDIKNNYFTFEGIKLILGEIHTTNIMHFSPQNPIPIHKREDNVLYVKAGGNLKDNKYTWHKDSMEYKSIVGDSTLVVTEPGAYYCKVVANNKSKYLSLKLESKQAVVTKGAILKLDSLELVKLHNATNGSQWKTKWNLTQSLSTWHGVTLTDDSSHVKTLSLPQNRLKGSLPSLNLPKLDTLDLSENQLSGSIPDFNNLNSLETLDISMNRFTFRGVPDSINVSTFEYFPQNVIGIYKSNIDKLYVNAGRGDTYTWYKDKVEYTTIQGDSTLTAKESGAYYCEVTKTVSLKGGNKKDIVLNSNILYMGAIQSQENQLTKRITREWDDDMLVFPNPAKERVYIYVPEEKGKQIDIQVFDQSGNLRIERSIKQFTDEKLTVDLSSLSHGYYYVRVQVEGKYMGIKTLIISH